MVFFSYVLVERFWFWRLGLEDAILVLVLLDVNFLHDGIVE